MTKYITKSFIQTQKLGQKLAQEIIRSKSKNLLAGKAVVLYLHGDLGGGKTTFLQGFAKGLGIKEKILSPTFVIMKKFPVFSKDTIVAFGKSEWFYHLDCYRLQNEKDAKELGLLEIFKNPQNIVAIEWPERIKKILPKTAIKINFEFISKNQRSIDITGF